MNDAPELPQEDRSCYVCGDPCRYGERHHQCGAAILRAEDAARAPLLAEIERLKHQLELAEHASVSQSQLYSEYTEEWQKECGGLRAQLEAEKKDAERWRRAREGKRPIWLVYETEVLGIPTTQVVVDERADYEIDAARAEKSK